MVLPGARQEFPGHCALPVQFFLFPAAALQGGLFGPQLLSFDGFVDKRRLRKVAVLRRNRPTKCSTYHMYAGAFVTQLLLGVSPPGRLPGVSPPGRLPVYQFFEGLARARYLFCHLKAV